MSHIKDKSSPRPQPQYNLWHWLSQNQDLVIFTGLVLLMIPTILYLVFFACFGSPDFSAQVPHTMLKSQAKVDGPTTSPPIIYLVGITLFGALAAVTVTLSLHVRSLTKQITHISSQQAALLQRFEAHQAGLDHELHTSRAKTRSQQNEFELFKLITEEWQTREEKKLDELAAKSAANKAKAQADVRGLEAKYNDQDEQFEDLKKGIEAGRSRLEHKLDVLAKDVEANNKAQAPVAPKKERPASKPSMALVVVKKKPASPTPSPSPYPLPLLPDSPPPSTPPSTPPKAALKALEAGPKPSKKASKPPKAQVPVVDRPKAIPKSRRRPAAGAQLPGPAEGLS